MIGVIVSEEAAIRQGGDPARDGTSTSGEVGRLVEAGEAVGVGEVGAALEEGVDGFGASDPFGGGEEGRGGAEGGTDVGEGGIEVVVEGWEVGGIVIEIAVAHHDGGLRMSMVCGGQVQENCSHHHPQDGGEIFSLRFKSDNGDKKI